MNRRVPIGTLWYTRCPMPTASSVAITRGWLDREFAADGIDVVSLRAAADRSERLAHYDHASPALFREGGVVPPLWARSRGAATRLLGVGLESGFRGLVVGPGSDVTDPASLRGRRVAVPRRIGEPIDFARAVSWRGIVECLGLAGLDVPEVELVDVTTQEPYLTEAPPSASGSLYTAWENVRSQSAEVVALVRGDVDAIFATGGYGLEVAALVGGRVLLDLSARDPWAPWSPNHLRVLTVSETLLDRRPDLVVRYVATVQRAAAWASEHDEEAIRTIAAEVGLAEEWTRLGYHPDTPSHLGLERSDGALDRLDGWVGFLADHGFLDGPVDVGRWLDPEPLALADRVVADDPVARAATHDPVDRVAADAPPTAWWLEPSR